MKYKVLVFVAFMSLCGCNNRSLTSNNSSVTDDGFNNNVSLSSDNYSKFLKIEHNNTYHKTVVSPLFNKHIEYSNLIFTFQTSYQISVRDSGSATYHYENYDHIYSVSVDESGTGSELFFANEHKSLVSNYPANAFTHELVMVSGNAEFEKDGCQISRLRNDDRNQTYTVTYDKTIRYQANYNVQITPDTDAFYVIESVTMTFRASQNNVEKNHTYTFYPDLYGRAEAQLEKGVDTSYLFENVKYTVNNGFILQYQ